MSVLFLSQKSIVSSNSESVSESMSFLSFMFSSIFCSYFGFSIWAVSTAGTKLVAKMLSLANGEWGLYFGLGG